MIEYASLPPEYGDGRERGRKDRRRGGRKGVRMHV